MPRGKKISKAPEFGYREIGFLEANGLGTLLEVGETIRAEAGEEEEEFLARLKKLLSIGHSGDRVRIIYKKGEIQYALVTRRAYDPIPAPEGDPIGAN